MNSGLKPRLVICDIEETSRLNQDTDPNAYVAIAEFYIPPFYRHAALEDFSIRSDPAPCALSELDAFTEDGYTSSSLKNIVPFTIGALHRLFVVMATVSTHGQLALRQNATLRIGIFIPLSTFLPYLLSPKSSAIIYGTPLDYDSDDGPGIRVNSTDEIAVRWEEWIPSGTRMLILPEIHDVWSCNVYGAKFVHAEGHLRRPRRIIVLDFNSPDVLRSVQGEVDESENGNDEVEDKAAYSEDVIQPTTIESSHNVFAVDVTTSVPYRTICSKEKFDFDGVMITEDNVVLVKVSRNLCIVHHPDKIRCRVVRRNNMKHWYFSAANLEATRKTSSFICFVSHRTLGFLVSCGSLVRQ